MKEKVIDINKVYLFSLPCIIIGTPLLIMVYRYFHGTEYRETLIENPYSLISLILVTFSFILLHELIHGICFAVFSKKRFKSIRFGVMWSHLAPYCHCEDAITAKQYRIVLLMPTLLLGFLPMLTGLIVGNFLVFFAGVMLVWGGVGDITAYFLTKKVSGDTLIVDHPNKVGFYYNDKI